MACVWNVCNDLMERQWDFSGGGRMAEIYEETPVERWDGRTVSAPEARARGEQTD